ncbi:Poly(U)-specific endoribonuclease [Holothuria leucospilota]|uniref:Uridylate-specific endoribonuclease n=1 Tax=Holothuria leucospilota TaxID=206669 RepID=A0A9Q1H5R3_HOLLE|nr:Poly(U)-specific endoribonuclease [Holothuria leucospilota]
MKQVIALLLCACILRSAVGNTSLCANRCLIDYDASLPCQCNDVCGNYGNCCEDYYTVGCNTASTSRCEDRCLVGYDSSLPCQCNDQCKSFGNCCSDFDAVDCAAVHSGETGSMTLAEFAEDLWANDENRVASSRYTYNRGTYISNTNDKTDVSLSNFFSYFDSSILNGATISKFYALLNNYIATEGNTESFTSTENNEITAFLDAIFSTTVMQKTVTYLINEGLVSSESDLRNKMDTMWFEPYNRQGTDDSSGFEHVFLGEWKSSTTVNGFHNWIQFYKEENEGDINYFGYVEEANPNLISMQFSWGSSSRVKKLTSIMLGASPEFEMAMFTTCFLKHKGSLCTFTLDGHTVQIQTYSQNTDQVGSAYFAV